jgi:hypothetical protein
VSALLGTMLHRKPVVIQPGVRGQHRVNVRRVPSQRPRQVRVCAFHGLVHCADRIMVEWKG